MSSSDLVAFLSDSSAEVAPQLLGMQLTTRVAGVQTTISLTEVESYSQDDPASHTFSGPTPRNRPMFERGGYVYVYRSYGIHWCVNIVTGPQGRGEAVLIRGGTPIRGIDVMERRRGRPDHLSDGPGKLCQALAIDGAMTGSRLGRFITLEGTPGTATWTTTPRIGITKATDELLRFVASSPAG